MIDKKEKFLKIYILFLAIITFVVLYGSIYKTGFGIPSNILYWSTIYAMSGAAVLLYHSMIVLMPTGHGFSLDSSLFLASIFIFGIQTTLLILIISSIFYGISQYQKRLSIQVINFSIYTIALTSANMMFVLFGGKQGQIDSSNIYQYIIALCTFMIINTLLVAIYFSMKNEEKVNKVVKSMFMAAIPSYALNLLLSIVLSVLLFYYQVFGLFLFIAIAILLSITFKKHYEYYNEAQKRAIKDQLTGLFNHGYFEDKLEEQFQLAKESNESLCLVLIDIDDFKKFNDTYGHYRGDQLLKFIAQLLKEECVKHDDWFVARYGGEEFTFILPGVGEQEAYTFINKLRKKVNDSYFEGVEVLPYGCISFSAGVTQLDAENTFDKSKLLDDADQAMYFAKAQGKNQVRIYDEHIKTIHSLDIEADIARLEQPLNFFLAKDVYTYQHSKRVYQYAVEFSLKLELPFHERKALILGALIHDIGKIEIPREILNKKEKLADYEWQMIKNHVVWGKEIIAKHEHLHDLQPLVELHHERFDGRGYPHGLYGHNIPKLARILCIVDSFDAMTTERPYQKTRTFDQAFVELRKCAGTQFDPEFIEPFIELIKENHYQEEFVTSASSE